MGLAVFHRTGATCSEQLSLKGISSQGATAAFEFVPSGLKTRPRVEDIRDVTSGTSTLSAARHGLSNGKCATRPARVPAVTAFLSVTVGQLHGRV